MGGRDSAYVVAAPVSIQFQSSSASLSWGDTTAYTSPSYNHLPIIQLIQRVFPTSETSDTFDTSNSMLQVAIMATVFYSVCLFNSKVEEKGAMNSCFEYERSSQSLTSFLMQEN